MMKRIKALSVVLLIFALFLAGCKTKETTTGPTGQKAYPVTITDFADREVTVEKPPERVIVLTGYWAEIMHCLGLDDRIVGVGKYTSYDKHLPKELREKPAVGDLFHDLNWETVVSLKPDLIITDWYGGKYKDKKIIKKAEELKIPVIALTAKNVEDNIKVVRLLGKIFGKEKKAEEIAGWMEEKLQKAKEIAKSIPADKKKKVLLISGSSVLNGGLISICAKGDAWASMVELVGARNLAFDKNFNTQWPKLDLEKIIAYWGNETDVLLVYSFSEKILEKAISTIKNDTRWKAIKAVNEGHIYGILAGSKGYLDWGPRIIAGTYQMGKLIYPEYYPDWKPIAEGLLQKFYGKKHYPVTVTDFEGRKVTINKQPERIVILSAQVAELLYCWHHFDKVVGIPKWAKYNPILTELTNLKNITDVGTGHDPNVEEIISLKPDLVITYGGETGYSTPKEAVNKVEKSGIPVVLVDLYNLSDLYRSVEIVGKIMNEEERAEETVNYMKSVINMVKKKANKIPENKRIKAIWTWNPSTRVTGNEGVPNDLIVNAGAINPASEVTGRYVTVSLEKIIEWNPDVIIIWGFPKYGPEELIKDSRWRDINAIKNKRVYKQPKLLGDTWSIRVAVLQAWMFDKFYPGKIDFYNVANDFFKHFYGVSYEELEKRMKK